MNKEDVPNSKLNKIKTQMIQIKRLTELQGRAPLRASQKLRSSRKDMVAKSRPRQGAGPQPSSLSPAAAAGNLRLPSDGHVYLNRETHNVTNTVTRSVKADITVAGGTTIGILKHQCC